MSSNAYYGTWFENIMYSLGFTLTASPRSSWIGLVTVAGTPRWNRSTARGHSMWYSAMNALQGDSKEADEPQQDEKGGTRSI